MRLPGCSHWQGQREPHNPNSLNASSKSPNRLGSQARNLCRQTRTGYDRFSSFSICHKLSSQLSTVDICWFKKCGAHWCSLSGDAFYNTRLVLVHMVRGLLGGKRHEQRFSIPAGYSSSGVSQIQEVRCSILLQHASANWIKLKGERILQLSIQYYTILYPCICPMRPAKLTNYSSWLQFH